MLNETFSVIFKHCEKAPENQCYLSYGSNSDLPDGIFSVEKCVQGVPMAVSLPHFLHADEW